MARATKLEVQTTITLTLTMSEAVTIRSLMDFVGGNPMTTRRKHCDDIRYALEDVDVPRDDAIFEGGITAKV